MKISIKKIKADDPLKVEKARQMSIAAQLGALPQTINAMATATARELDNLRWESYREIGMWAYSARQISAIGR